MAEARSAEPAPCRMLPGHAVALAQDRHVVELVPGDDAPQGTDADERPVRRPLPQPRLLVEAREQGMGGGQID